jgi:hypothetical protein
MPPTYLSQEDSKQLAKHIVDALMVKLADEQAVAAIANVWGKYLDQWIGRGFRRFAWYVLCAALIAGALKFQIWNFMNK